MPAGRPPERARAGPSAEMRAMAPARDGRTSSPTSMRSGRRVGAWPVGPTSGTPGFMRGSCPSWRRRGVGHGDPAHARRRMRSPSGSRKRVRTSEDEPGRSHSRNGSASGRWTGSRADPKTIGDEPWPTVPTASRSSRSPSVRSCGRRPTTRSRSRPWPTSRPTGPWSSAARAVGARLARLARGDVPGPGRRRDRRVRRAWSGTTTAPIAPSTR